MKNDQLIIDHTTSLLPTLSHKSIQHESIVLWTLKSCSFYDDWVTWSPIELSWNIIGEEWPQRRRFTGIHSCWVWAFWKPRKCVWLILDQNANMLFGKWFRQNTHRVIYKWFKISFPLPKLFINGLKYPSLYFHVLNNINLFFFF